MFYPFSNPRPIKSAGFQQHGKFGTRMLLLAALFATSCSMNEVGIRLHKKPDLTAVTPGTPLNKVRGLGKPIKREVVTKGELQGAEMRLYEWDLKDDDVNNRMFTSVVVKDGVILGWHEDTPAKWQKNPQLYKMAKLDSALENLAKAQANYAATQMAIGAAGAYMANRASYDPMQYYNTAFANTYKPWENAQTVNNGMVGGGPIPFGGGNQSASMTPAKVYATRPNSGGLRDFNKSQPVGVIEDGKVYATRPNSGGLRDFNKSQPVGVIEDGKVYATRPNSGGLRDYGKTQPIGVIGDQ